MKKTDIIKHIKNVAQLYIKYSEKVTALEQSLSRKEQKRVTFDYVADDYVEVSIGKQVYSYDTKTKKFEEYTEEDK